MNRLISLGAAALMAAGAAGVTACSSSSSSTTGGTGAAANGSATAAANATSAPASGTETATGEVTGAAALANNPQIPVAWSGPVATTGTFSTGGGSPAKGQHHVFKTAAGDFAVVVSATPSNTQKLLSGSSCEFEYATSVPYRVDAAASTGKFAGAAGSGVVTVTFRAYLPKLANGKCNMSNNATPLTQGAVASFRSSGPLTVKS